ncbi:MAG TPA: hypothetical protein PKA94_06160, partial [Ferruginibacter sp.]|nr:hypothetical protein [Ferruginibacter sp.]
LGEAVGRDGPGVEVVDLDAEMDELADGLEAGEIDVLDGSVKGIAGASVADIPLLDGGDEETAGQ